jgi:hypothetical protein
MDMKTVSPVKLFVLWTTVQNDLVATLSSQLLQVLDQARSNPSTSILLAHDHVFNVADNA